jgi:drug/metabolite transporter (DMT)-like permease
MGAVVGAILILAGSVLIAAGIIANGLNRAEGNSLAGYVLGGSVGVIGLAVLVSGPIVRATRQSDEKNSGPSESTH